MGPPSQHERWSETHWWCCAAGSMGQAPLCEPWPGRASLLCSKPDSRVFSTILVWKIVHKLVHLLMILQNLETCEESNSKEPISTGFRNKMSSTATSVGLHPLKDTNTAMWRNEKLLYSQYSVNNKGEPSYANAQALAQPSS